jgi:predicted transcriptional regulator
MTLQLTPAQEKKFQELAAASDRSASELVEEVISQYLDEVEIQASELREAEESAERDGWLTTDEVFARLNLNFRKTA